MPDSIGSAHTNLMANDWRALVDFYCQLFDCVPVPPERDISGDKIECMTALPGAHLRGMHIRLPGHGDAGPTLKMLAYDEMLIREAPAVNRPGYGHLAFEVPDVAAKYAEVMAAGGGAIGETVTLVREGLPPLTMVYVQDPEGNIIELQRWG